MKPLDRKDGLEEVDMSAELEKQNVEYEKTANISITIIHEVGMKIELMKASGYGTEAYLKEYLEDPNYVAEEKLDGCRYVLHIAEDGKVTLLSGGHRDASANAPHLVNLPIWQNFKGTILDGEICSRVNKLPVVAGIMNSHPPTAIARQKEVGEVEFYVFDILKSQGVEITDHSMKFRRQVLEEMFSVEGDFGKVHLVKQFTGNKKSYFDEIVKNGGEGIMLKNLHATYKGGNRPSDTWVKVKKVATYDAIATGASEGQGKYVGTLGALKISQYINGELKEVGQISGMTDAKRKEFWERIQKGEQWVVEFEAQERTDYHHYRHPQYKQDRPEKPLKDCTW